MQRIGTRVALALGTVALVSALSACDFTAPAPLPYLEVRSSSSATVYVPQCAGTSVEAGVFASEASEGKVFGESAESASEGTDGYLKAELDVEGLAAGTLGNDFTTYDFQAFEDPPASFSDLGGMTYTDWRSQFYFRVYELASLEPGLYRYEALEWHPISDDELAEALKAPIPECG